MAINRREWMQQSMLASAALLFAGTTTAYGCATGFSKRVEGEPLQLNWNENPYGPSDSAKKAVNDAMRFANRYPDDMAEEVKEKLAKRNGVQSANILLTAGSTEILSLLGQHVALNGGNILTPYPTFPTMLQFGMSCGAGIDKVDLDANDRIDLNAVKRAINNKTQLIFICNPNNPTGTELPTDDLKSFCKSVPANILICVDEAYIEYSNAGLAGSMVSLVKELPNLIIARTFSKTYGLAGLRMGYAVSSSANITALRNRHLGFELSTGWPPLVAASATLDDEAFLKMCIAKNSEGRAIVYKAFDEWGVKYNQSSTNFIYTRHDRFDKDVVAKMKERGVLITKWPDMYNHIRISIGKPNEMETCVEVIKDFLI
jgi:histidinol-phosphate aminotransferase